MPLANSKYAGDEEVGTPRDGQLYIHAHVASVLWARTPPEFASGILSERGRNGGFSYK